MNKIKCRIIAKPMGHNHARLLTSKRQELYYLIFNRTVSYELYGKKTTVKRKIWTKMMCHITEKRMLVGYIHTRLLEPMQEESYY